MTRLSPRFIAAAVAVGFILISAGCSKAPGRSDNIPQVPARTNDKPDVHIGLQPASILGRCKYLGGGVLGPSMAFSSTEFECNGEHLIVFEREIGRKGQRAETLILDGIYLPKPAAGAEFIPPQFCYTERNKEETIFAIGTWKRTRDGYDADNISHAWRFDFQLRKIKPIPTQGVKCDSDDPNPPE